MTDTDIRPYELPQHKYALWYAINQRFGPLAQAAVMVALADPKHRVWCKELTEAEVDYIKMEASRRSILLHYVE